MSKKVPQKDPPTKFTESYQFIQTMFQEPMTWQERSINLLSLIKRGFFVLGSLTIAISLVLAVIYFDVLSATLSDSGLHIPKRWP